MAMLVLTLACGAGGPGDATLGRQDAIPTPDRSQVQVIDDETPAGLTDADAISAYQQGYAHMRAAAWFSAIAAYDEAIRIQPAVSGLYEARGTAYMYASRHDQALADYTHAIELNPNDAGHWRRRATTMVAGTTTSRPLENHSNQKLMGPTLGRGPSVAPTRFRGRARIATSANPIAPSEAGTAH